MNKNNHFHLALVGAVVAFILGVQGSAVAEEESCVKCHREVGGELGTPVKLWEKSVHASVGVGCAECHGGDPSISDEGAMDPSKGFIGVPERKDIPKLCAKCHSDPTRMRPYKIRTDQLALYKTSVHGKRFFGGDMKVATCTDCHSIHNILKSDDPKSPVYKRNVPETCGKCHSNKKLMSTYGVPADVVEEYMKSYHARIVFGKIPGKNPMLAPVCNDCHGNHGAAPPGFKEVAEVCGSCHFKTEKYFKQSPHYTALEELGTPRCVDCHGNHNIQFPDESLFLSEDKGCLKCHDKGSKPEDVGKTILGVIKDIQKGVEEKKEDVEFAEASGKAVDDIVLAYTQAKNSLVRILPMAHSLDTEQVKEIGRDAFAKLKIAEEKVNKIREEFEGRKTFLYATIAFILFLVVLLFLKLWEIKRMEKSIVTEK